MKIQIRERLRPFTHQYGTLIPLPRSFYSVQLFPTHLIFHDLRKGGGDPVHELALDITGPIHEWSATLDLESASIQVSGHAQEGFFRFHLFGNRESVLFDDGDERHLILGSHFEPSKNPPLPRISFGCHKKADWQQVVKRNCIQEVLPFWAKLGRMMPEVPLGQGGTLDLLEELSTLSEKLPEERLPLLEKCWRLAFHGLLTPTTRDLFHQGERLSHVEADVSPLPLLTEGARLIEKLLYSVEGLGIELLPALPSPLYCGRVTGIEEVKGAKIDFEWTKKVLRRVAIDCSEKIEIALTLPKRVKRFRLRSHKCDRGQWKSSGEPLTLEKDGRYLLDNFER